MIYSIKDLQRRAGIHNPTINESRLDEGANDRYLQLFQGLLQMPEVQSELPSITKRIDEFLQRVRSVLKKDDRVI